MGSINPVRFVPEVGDSSPNTTPARVVNHPPATVLQDVADVATVPSLSQVEPLQKTGNPSQFQVVLTDAVRQLKAAAFQSTDPFEAAYLSGLANQFQRLEETGIPSLSATT